MNESNNGNRPVADLEVAESKRLLEAFVAAYNAAEDVWDLGASAASLLERSNLVHARKREVEYADGDFVEEPEELPSSPIVETEFARQLRVASRRFASMPFPILVAVALLVMAVLAFLVASLPLDQPGGSPQP